MSITAAQVKSLRDETGLPMMECKSALAEANGDTEQAKDILQKKYKGKMESRSGNETGEGRISIHLSADGQTGAIVDLRCETAPVAKTDRFIALSNTFAKTAASQRESSPTVDSVLALRSVDHASRTLSDEITEAFGVIRENIKFAGCRRLTGGYVCGYVHHDGKSGVLVALDAKPNPESVATDLCHHVTFSQPVAIERDGVPAAAIERVRRTAREIAESEGKPPQIAEKIVEGKVNAYCAENALMEQEHVKVSKTKVRDVLSQAGVKKVIDFAVFKIG